MTLSPEERPGPTAEQPLNRRQVLGFGAAAVAATVLAPGASGTAALGAPNRLQTRTATADLIRPTIRPRLEWAGDRGVTGELVVEDDVRFLLVHHTASSNTYQPDEVIGQIRGFYDFHTGPEKEWPDVAYNFFVDRFGEIWEGREGSIDRPIQGSATGGSQGFALLCSLIGNFQEAPVPAAQQEGLVRLLAWLGETYGIDTAPGAVTNFVSRGSSRWPRGTEVTAATISGHRDMSTTGCPGDFAYPLLAEDIPTRVSAVRTLATSTSSTSRTTSSSTSVSSTSTTTTESAPQTLGDEAMPDIALGEESDRGPLPLVVAGGLVGAVAAAAGLFSRMWKRADDVG